MLSRERPFRADLPELVRHDLKARIGDQLIPLDWQAACARELGWIATVVGDSRLEITTHNLRVFQVEGTYGI